MRSETIPAGRPVGSRAPRSALVFSLASETFGSSNGLIPRAAPATAVANSQRKNSAPSESSRVLRRSTGWPAASSAAQPVCIHGRPDRCAIATNARSAPYSSGSPERLRRRPAARPCRACRCSRRSAARSRARAWRATADRTAVSLSRPFAAAAPMKAPSSRPGLVRLSCRQPSAIVSPAESRSDGRAPDEGRWNEAEKRQRGEPTADVRRVDENLAIPPRSGESLERGPGSVMAMKWRPARSAERRGSGVTRKALHRSTSTVPPLLLATRNQRSVGRHAAATVWSVCSSVVSRT